MGNTGIPQNFSAWCFPLPLHTHLFYQNILMNTDFITLNSIALEQGRKKVDFLKLLLLQRFS